MTSEVSRPPRGMTPHFVSSSTCEDPSPKLGFLPSLSKTQKDPEFQGWLETPKWRRKVGAPSLFCPREGA